MDVLQNGELLQGDRQLGPTFDYKYLSSLKEKVSPEDILWLFIEKLLYIFAENLPRFNVCLSVCYLTPCYFEPFGLLGMTRVMDTDLLNELWLVKISKYGWNPVALIYKDYGAVLYNKSDKIIKQSML